MLLGTIRIDEGKVRGPMLCVGGDDDHFIPLRTVQRTAAKYRSPLHVAPGHGHLLMQEPGWESVADAIATWIDANASSTHEQSARSQATSAS
jgi:pimeloyl-ACP methyl ester carboxylesterase